MAQLELFNENEINELLIQDIIENLERWESEPEIVVKIPKSDLPPFFDIDDFIVVTFDECKSFLNQLSESDKESRVFCELKAKENPNKFISLMKKIVSMSTDQWNEFILYGMAEHDDSRLACRYEFWPKYSKGNNKGSPRKEHNKVSEALAAGIVSLFFDGWSFAAAKEFICLRNCKFSMIREFSKFSQDMQFSQIRDRLAGSYENMHGNYRERLPPEIFNDYLYDVGEQDNFIAGKSFQTKDIPAVCSRLNRKNKNFYLR